MFPGLLVSELISMGRYIPNGSLTYVAKTSRGFCVRIHWSEKRRQVEHGVSPSHRIFLLRQRSHALLTLTNSVSDPKPKNINRCKYLISCEAATLCWNFQRVNTYPRRHQIPMALPQLTHAPIRTPSQSRTYRSKGTSPNCPGGKWIKIVRDSTPESCSSEQTRFRADGESKDSSEAGGS